MYRSIGGGVKLIDSSYTGHGLVKPVLVSEHLIKETLGIKIDDDVILMNDDNIEYYSILGRKGFGSWKSSSAHAVLHTFGGLFGTLASTTIDLATGGKNKRQAVFIKLKDNSRILVIVEDGYGHLLRSKKKVDKDEIYDNDLRWIRRSLEEHPVYL